MANKFYIFLTVVIMIYPFHFWIHKHG